MSEAIVVGIDEAGTGSAISDVYACAMILDPKLESYKYITDSKKLTPKQRDDAFEAIQNSDSLYGVGIVPHTELDNIGMAKARRLVFIRALDELRTKYDSAPKDHVLVDECVVSDGSFNRIVIDGTIGIDYEQAKTIECVPKADFKFPAVSAASIVAKVSRDRSVLDLCAKNPELAERYGWSSNKGYLSKIHSEAIGTYGLSDFHRKSFTYKALS